MKIEPEGDPRDAKAVGTKAELNGSRGVRAWVVALNLLATIHLVWFYVSHVQAEIHLAAYEQGLERTPFQHRLLLMYPMRWAHNSALLNHAAPLMKAGWFPNGARPEGILQALIDVLCVVVTGIVATKIYNAASRTRLLSAVVYPLTLVMCATTYALLTNHQLRFLYDLPAMAFFAVGLYLLYFRRHPLLFAGVFAIATINRETTLFLLLYFAIAQCVEGTHLHWKRLLRRDSIAVLVPLSILWIGWHLWVVRHFALNPSDAHPRFLLNVGTMLFPLAWPQIFGAFAYLTPLVLIFRRDIPDPLLRAWLWVLAPWFCFMLYFGLMMEIRIFGELIPYMACVTTLLFEERLLLRIAHRPPELVPVAKAVPSQPQGSSPEAYTLAADQ